MKYDNNYQLGKHLSNYYSFILVRLVPLFFSVVFIIIFDHDRVIGWALDGVYISLLFFLVPSFLLSIFTVKYIIIYFQTIVAFEIKGADLFIQTLYGRQFDKPEKQLQLDKIRSVLITRAGIVRIKMHFFRVHNIEIYEKGPRQAMKEFFKKNNISVLDYSLAIATPPRYIKLVMIPLAVLAVVAGVYTEHPFWGAGGAIFMVIVLFSAQHILLKKKIRRYQKNH